MPHGVDTRLGLLRCCCVAVATFDLCCVVDINATGWQAAMHSVAALSSFALLPWGIVQRVVARCFHKFCNRVQMQGVLLPLWLDYKHGRTSGRVSPWQPTNFVLLQHIQRVRTFCQLQQQPTQQQSAHMQTSTHQRHQHTPRGVAQQCTLN